MTKNLVSSKRRVLIVANVAALIMAGAMLTWLGSTAQAQERTSAPQRVEVLASAASRADLERAFWLCDYAGTNGGVDSGAAATCSAVTEELKIRNFNGNFDAMVVWWRQHKPAKHQALKAASRASAGTATAAPASL